MPATFEWNEDNGATAGGAGRSTAVNQVNWKNAKDVATAYNQSPITAGQNSYHKNQFGKFTGTFTRIYGAKWGWTAKGTPDPSHQDIDGVKVKLVGKVSSTYTEPSTSALSGAAALTLNADVGVGGLDVKFSTAGPDGALTTDTLGHGQGLGYDLTAAGYTQYLMTQIQTTTDAVAGDTVTATFTLRYNEN